MYLDQVNFLPDDILVKVDRATMAVGLEGRAPFLDHELAAFAWRLPAQMKIRHGRGKWLLRQLLGSYLPAAFIDRPKMGFAVPLERWLTGPLRAWGGDLLSGPTLARQQLFRPEAVARLWQQHERGGGREYDVLWSLLMFQAWLERQ